MIKNHKKFSKTISLAVIALTLLVGCSAENQASTDETHTTSEKAPMAYTISDENSITMEVAKSISDNKNNYHFLDDTDSLLEGKEPYLSVIYVDKADLEGEEPGETMTLEFIYPIKDSPESSALKLYSQYGELSDVKIDEFTGSTKADYADTDYKIIQYSSQKIIDLSDFSFDSTKNSLKGTDVSELSSNLNVDTPTIELVPKASNSNIYFYIIGDKAAPEAKGLFILTKNGKVNNMKIGEPYLNLDELNNMLDASTY
ncbi:hypothetical protein [Tepidibacter aestuarii]|uniref:hypothetical protein n=1 Tax=Tepidibacter aestuarii TaxID=2925782 RepID=UPI0020BE71F4|nr:hypothetical protein [Tepidibacter aestuarii]CAH2212514.1 exported protein of unknown function [Tepidibacter aestuarii]